MCADRSTLIHHSEKDNLNNGSLRCHTASTIPNPGGCSRKKHQLPLQFHQYLVDEHIIYKAGGEKGHWIFSSSGVNNPA